MACYELKYLRKHGEHGVLLREDRQLPLDPKMPPNIFLFGSFMVLLAINCSNTLLCPRFEPG